MDYQTEKFFGNTITNRKSAKVVYKSRLYLTLLPLQVGVQNASHKPRFLSFRGLFEEFSPCRVALILDIHRLSGKMTIFAHGYILISQKQR